MSLLTCLALSTPGILGVPALLGPPQEGASLQGTGWTVLGERFSPRRPIRRVAERGYGWLQAQGDVLERTRSGEKSELDTLEPEGTGTLYELAADPAGLVFVAAENGLFVLSPEVDVLDRVEVLDGAPPGSPTSVFVDEERRVWYASETAFGCIDPSFYHGRTIPVPGPGPYRIVGNGRYGIDVAGAEAEWRYRPGVGRAPRLDRVSRDGTELAAEQLLELDFGEPIHLTAEGVGSSELVPRYRVDRHHKWLALENGVDVEIEPGEHLLEVVLTDRDLRLSEPFPLRLRVAYPFYYRKAFVLGAGALCAVLVFLFFHAIGRRARLPGSHAIVSTVLVLVLGLQTLAGLVPHGRGWPFIGYSMYTTSLDVGHLAYNGILIGLTAKDRPRQIHIGALGVAADNRWQVLGPLIRDGEATNHAAIEKYNRERPTWIPIRRLQVWAERTRLTEGGPVPVAQLILSDHALPATEEEDA